MDMWKYFNITHEYQEICDPVSSEKINELVGLLKLKKGSAILDIACGKGEILTKIAERYEVSGSGVDFSPYFAAHTRRKLKERAPGLIWKFWKWMEPITVQPVCLTFRCVLALHGYSRDTGDIKGFEVPDKTGRSYYRR
jgi:SAM-dependent methyltransferase